MTHHPHMVPSALSLLISLDGDNVGIIHDKIAAKFAESSPDIEGCSMEAIKEHWKKLLEIYRYVNICFFIKVS
jgi:hypothetical protein